MKKWGFLNRDLSEFWENVLESFIMAESNKSKLFNKSSLITSLYLVDDQSWSQHPSIIDS